jgi:hypothetical protein
VSVLAQVPLQAPVHPSAQEPLQLPSQLSLQSARAGDDAVKARPRTAMAGMALLPDLSKARRFIRLLMAAPSSDMPQLRLVWLHVFWQAPSHELSQTLVQLPAQPLAQLPPQSLPHCAVHWLVQAP